MGEGGVGGTGGLMSASGLLFIIKRISNGGHVPPLPPPPPPPFSTALTGEEGGRKEMLYLTMHSTHFIYGYLASDIW